MVDEKATVKQPTEQGGSVQTGFYPGDRARGVRLEMFLLAADTISILLRTRGLDSRDRFGHMMNTESTSMIHLLDLRRTRGGLTPKKK
jgi:hypothetical protein